jgi:hypothetical protein
VLRTAEALLLIIAETAVASGLGLTAAWMAVEREREEGGKKREGKRGRNRKRRDGEKGE